MVISVPSLQDTEIYRPKPSPVYSFVDDVNKMVDIKGEETALQASRREAQEGVKVKFPNDCVLVHYFTVSHRLSMCKSLEIHVPSMTVNPSILAPPSARPCRLYVKSPFFKGNWFWVCTLLIYFVCSFNHNGNQMIVHQQKAVASLEFSDLFIQK